jgi:hypothetical protein
MDHCPGRAGPLWEGGNIASERRVVNLVNQDPEERGRLVTRVGPQFRGDLDDECRGDSGEQTSLLPNGW